MSTKKNWNTILGIGAVAAMVIAAIFIFLLSKDDGYSGVQALKDQSTAFWVGVAISFAVAIYGIRVMIKSETSTWGTTSFTLGLLVVVVLLLFGPFGKACTDKANHGITSPTEQVGK